MCDFFDDVISGLNDFAEYDYVTNGGCIFDTDNKEDLDGNDDSLMEELNEDSII